MNDFERLKYMINSTRYIANEGGIWEERDEVDENGEIIRTTSRPFFPKEAFIVAYNAYIKDGGCNG